MALGRFFQNLLIHSPKAVILLGFHTHYERPLANVFAQRGDGVAQNKAFNTLVGSAMKTAAFVELIACATLV